MRRILGFATIMICTGLLFGSLSSCSQQHRPQGSASRVSKPPERAGKRGDLYYDLIEDDPKLKASFEAASGQAKEEMEAAGEKDRKGLGHVFDQRKKRILKVKYGIEWRTTSEMNPEVIFD